MLHVVATALMLAGFSTLLWTPLGAPSMLDLRMRNTTRILGFLGRSDAGEGAYFIFVQALQDAAASQGVSMLVVSGTDWNSLLQNVLKARAELPGAPIFFAGHSMTGGADTVQSEAPKQKGAAGVILISGFLRRPWRPSVAECQRRWIVQPNRSCPQGKGLPFCPGGYLAEGVHACEGPAVPAPVYPLPTLTVGGSLDGVVRVARIAEAWYTQQSTPEHRTALVDGMNHGDIMDVVPDAVASTDLASEMAPGIARSEVAKLVVAMAAGGRLPPQSLDAVFAPFVEMFVEQEGSWWWTSNSDEQGCSAWAAQAQEKMASPMPAGYDVWKISNQFRMLSDEELIPPYYRQKHRPNVTLATDGRTLLGSTIAQLRYIQVSVAATAAGLNGWAIIREEKAGVLSQPGFVDDGVAPVSAIEIGTKLASRQLAYQTTGASAPASLDDGDRCRSVNQAAYNLALAAASPTARARCQAKGRRLLMGPDRKPTPPAGPWWIWNYLDFAEAGSGDVEVRSWYAFYPLSGPAYGAGNHYCKLLSPARALEWVYTDCLRPVLATVPLAV